MTEFSDRKVMPKRLDVHNLVQSLTAIKPGSACHETEVIAASHYLTSPPGADSAEETPAPMEEGRGAESRSALLEAALHCFAIHGFDGTSIRDIANKAQRNSSLISHHFGSKEGLYIEVFRHLFQVRKFAFGGDPDESCKHPGNRSEAILLLRDLIRGLFSDFNPWPECRDLMADLGRKLLLSELREPRPAVMAILREYAAPWFCKFGECLSILKPELTRVQRNFLGISIMGEMMSHILMQGVRPDEWGLEGLHSAQAVELLTEFNLRALGISGAAESI